MTEWKEYKLGEVAEIKNGKSRPKVSGKIPVYGGNGILDFCAKSNVNGKTIIIGRVGAYCGSVYFEDKEIWISDNALYAKSNKGFDSKFLYYLLKHDNLNQYAGGSSHPLLTQGRLNDLKYKLPPLPTQTAIAEILSSIDDKIELNNQINKDLEALAQALFKQWFIDFEYPNENGEPYRSSGGEMVDSELGEIPKDWIATSYGAITKKENLKVKKSKKSITKVYSAIKTSELVLSEDYFTKQVFSKSLENYYVVENFWFAYNPSRINIGSIGLNKNEAGAVSPVYVVFSAVDNMHFYIENHLKLESIKNEIVQKCSGTVRQALNYDSLSTFPVVKPPKSLIDKFNLFWSENSNSISQIKSETEYLIGLRDELLPKLISGELEVSDALK